MSYRLIELGKLQIKTELRDKREYMLNATVRKVKNKSGVVETRVFTCPECSEEYCMSRSCMDFNYDLFTRVVPKLPLANKVSGAGNANGDGSGKSGRGKKKISAAKGDKRKGKKRQRSKSPQKKSAGK